MAGASTVVIVLVMVAVGFPYMTGGRPGLLSNTEGSVEESRGRRDDSAGTEPRAY